MTKSCMFRELKVVYFVIQEKEEGGRGRFKSHSTDPARISDREKKAPLKT
jgi:hypothetical protein